MFSILKRYIAKTIILTTFVTSLIMMSIILLMSSLGEVKSIGSGDYGMIQAMFYVLLRLPNQLYQYSPIFILLGSIIGLSLLSSHRELSVMRASGFTIRNIIFGVLGAALVLIAGLSLIGEWIGPMLSSEAQIYKENAQNASQAVVTAAGIWLHIDNNFIHVQRGVDRELLENITRYQFDDNHALKAAYFAKTLTLKKNNWLMNDVVKTTFFNERTKSQAFTSLPLNLKFNPNLLNIGIVEPNDMTLPKLARFVHYLEHNGLQAKEYQYGFWQRIFQPFASLVMILLAIPFVLSTATTSTLSWRIMIGLMAGFAFFILNALLGQLSIVYQLPTMFAAAFPPLLFLIIGIFLAKRLIKQ